MTTPGPSPTGGAVFLATSPPASVGLEKSEVSAVAGLAPMMARSPRTLKRYINTYRLIKGLVEESDLEAARLLLAIATGRPAVGERLLVQVGTTDHHTLGELVDAWPEADRTWLKDSVPAELRTWPTWEMAKVRPAARAVWRFVFRSVPAENGWRRMPGGPAGARPGASAGPQLRVSAGRTRP